MARCMICNDTVHSGYVLCRECAQKLTPYTLPPELSLFISQLSDEIVRSNMNPACSMCAIGACEKRPSEVTCCNAVRAWLLGRAKSYLCAGEKSDLAGRCA